VKIGGRGPLFLDADLIRTLADLLDETGLSEIEYAVGDRRIRIARTGGALPPPSSNPAPSANDAPSSQSSTTAPAEPPGAVTAPMVGTVYLAPQPGAPPFVHPGEIVGEGQPLLIIEAMKVMNQIRAPRAGRVARIFVEDAGPVEYGAPLMLIE